MPKKQSLLSLSLLAINFISIINSLIFHIYTHNKEDHLGTYTPATVKERKEVLAEDKWNVETLYPNIEAWESAFNKIKEQPAAPYWPSLANIAIGFKRVLKLSKRPLKRFCLFLANSTNCTPMPILDMTKRSPSTNIKAAIKEFLPSFPIFNMSQPGWNPNS